jgi:LysR family glycine cleavage system transcriptional activator
MKRNLPPLPSVRIFEAAARHRSFTRAAAELGMTQAAVSYQIRLLEERIGVPLFVRAGKRVHLSAVGERLAPTMTEVLDLLASAFDEVAGRTHGTLNLCVIPTFASNWLAQRMGRFQNAHPRVSIRLSTSRHLADFSRGENDAAIAVGTGDWPGLESHELVKADITPMLAPQLSQRIGGFREPKDLLRCPLINPTDALWTLWFAAAGVERTVPDEEIGSNMGSQHLEGLAAAAGQGAAILTPFFHAESLAAGRLIQPFDLVCSSGQSYWLCYPRAHRNSLKIRAFRDWLLNELAT